MEFRFEYAGLQRLVRRGKREDIEPGERVRGGRGGCLRALELSTVLRGIGFGGRFEYRNGEARIAAAVKVRERAVCVRAVRVERNGLLERSHGLLQERIHFGLGRGARLGAQRPIHLPEAEPALRPARVQFESGFEVIEGFVSAAAVPQAYGRAVSLLIVPVRIRAMERIFHGDAS
jgi:hypothetical protein